MNDKERAILSLQLQIKSIDETLNTLVEERNRIVIKLNGLGE